jgi:hypothetical protein
VHNEESPDVNPNKRNEIRSILPDLQVSISLPTTNAKPVAVSMLDIRIKETSKTDNWKCCRMEGNAKLIAERSIKTMTAAILIDISILVFVTIMDLVAK